MPRLGSDGNRRTTARDAIPGIARIIRGLEGEVVFATCIDDDGSLGDSECFVSLSQPKNLLPVPALFHLACEMDAPQLMIASRSSGPIEALHDCDVDFTARVLDLGRLLGIRVCEHVLVDKDAIRLMTKEAPYLWEERGMALERDPATVPDEDAAAADANAPADDAPASAEVPGEGADRQGDPEPGERGADQSERARK